MEASGLQERKEKKFIADNMLGRLARWLRMMGYDTLYVANGEDKEITRIAGSENRILLTRDRQLASRKGINSLYVEEIELEKQLKSVSNAFGLTFREETMRCSECNGELNAEERNSVRGLVPDGVYERNELFYRCGLCGKIYWKGSHWKRIKEVMGNVSSS